jgi:hypothetical protein
MSQPETTDAATLVNVDQMYVNAALQTITTGIELEAQLLSNVDDDTAVPVFPTERARAVRNGIVHRLSTGDVTPVRSDQAERAVAVMRDAIALETFAREYRASHRGDWPDTPEMCATMDTTHVGKMANSLERAVEVATDA